QSHAGVSRKAWSRPAPRLVREGEERKARAHARSHANRQGPASASLARGHREGAWPRRRAREVQQGRPPVRADPEKARAAGQGDAARAQGRAREEGAQEQGAEAVDDVQRCVTAKRRSRLPLLVAIALL